ncbi:cobalamin biosynthesis protein CobQ [Candidatus Microgenomates bacterium]|nr:MAG: cobalamin biosynthesis protein CobQ [Candidatus Microgenomates bacterium]
MKNYTLDAKRYTLRVGWLYPDLMSTYGDRGNIICLQKRCEWRGINTEVVDLDLGFKINDLKKCDLLFMGGAQDRQQKIVMEDLEGEKAQTLIDAIEKDVVGLYICGAYQFLGKYYKEADGTIIRGLSALDLYTENPGENHKRLIGNIVIQVCHSELVSGSRDSDLRQNDEEKTLVGFENHGGRTYLGKGVKPLGKVISGFGNNETDNTEGAVYKNSFGTYLHGPILPKNPHFADYLISKALEVKYKKIIDLSPLDDSLENLAHETIFKKMVL